jgi:hypothetical protein
MARSEQVKRAQKNKRERDKAENPVKYRHDRLFSAVKSFVKLHATPTDMIEINRIYREENTGGDNFEK